MNNLDYTNDTEKSLSLIKKEHQNHLNYISNTVDVLKNKSIIGIIILNIIYILIILTSFIYIKISNNSKKKKQ